jgi:hypothetical protein
MSVLRRFSKETKWSIPSRQSYPPAGSVCAPHFRDECSQFGNNLNTPSPSTKYRKRLTPFMPLAFPIGCIPQFRCSKFRQKALGVLNVLKRYLHAPTLVHLNGRIEKSRGSARKRNSAHRSVPILRQTRRYFGRLEQVPELLARIAYASGQFVPF